MEVDRILMDLPSPSSHVPSSAPPNHTHKFKLTPNHRENDVLDSNLRGIQKEEQQLQVSPSLGEVSRMVNECLLFVRNKCPS